MRIVGKVRVNQELRTSNKMTQGGWYWLLDRLLNGVLPAHLTHIAVGDGTIAPQEGDVALVNELARKALTSQTRDDLTDLIETTFDKNEAIFTWKEVGLFAGGTDTIGTGTLIARALLTEAKDIYRTATVTWQLEVTES